MATGALSNDTLNFELCELVTQPIMVSKHEKNSQAWKTFDIKVWDGRKWAVYNLRKVSLAYSSGTGNLLIDTPDDIGIADKVPIVDAALDSRYLYLSFLTVRQRSISIAVLKEKCKENFQKKADTHIGEENNEASDQTDHEPAPQKKKEHFHFY